MRGRFRKRIGRRFFPNGSVAVVFEVIPVINLPLPPPPDDAVLPCARVVRYRVDS